MDTGLKDTILAVITTNREAVSSEGAPIFYAKDEEEKERIALLLSKVTLGMVHDLENGCYVIIKH
ncbi:capping complex subunit for YIEGIA [Dethiothermospora halolimnae]|uniref:capping complex subunit for YIEGIA n=1 Tax=Dethiothermospora halolimnae TaxID=3114390 RepID=UPI003CCBAA16